MTRDEVQSSSANAGAVRMLREVAIKVRGGMIEPAWMILDGEAVDCGRIGVESMQMSWCRWADFIESIADRIERGDVVAFDINEVRAIGVAHKFTLEVKSGKAMGRELRDLLGDEIMDRARLDVLRRDKVTP